MTHDVAITLTSTHDFALVLLSVAIAVFASYTALDLAGQITAARGQARNAWLLGGATAMGVGIWSMHFVAMLAFRLPIPIAYDVPTVVASMLAAIVAAAIALFIVSRPAMGAAQLVVGGVLMGGGFGAMHYTGMAAMRLDAAVSYDPALFALSVVIAVVVSVLALWLAFRLRNETTGIGTLQRVVSALIMGAGIAGLHYTAMAAAEFTPTDPGSPSLAAAHAIGTPWLALSIAVATSLILGLALLGSLVSRRGAPAFTGAGATR